MRKIWELIVGILILSLAFFVFNYMGYYIAKWEEARKKEYSKNELQRQIEEIWQQRQNGGVK